MAELIGRTDTAYKIQRGFNSYVGFWISLAAHVEATLTTPFSCSIRPNVPQRSLCDKAGVGVKELVEQRATQLSPALMRNNEPGNPLYDSTIDESIGSLYMEGKIMEDEFSHAQLA